MNQAIDAAIAAALAAYYTSAQTDAAIAAAIAPYDTSAETDAAIAAAQLRNGQTWNGGPTFNLLRGSNVLRNLSVAGALTAMDDTILIESDSYARSETYTQAETGAAITAAMDALDLSQFQNEAEAGPHRRGPVELRGGRATIVAAIDESKGYTDTQLADYSTTAQMTQAISDALRNGGPAGRRNCGSPRGLLHVADGRRPRGGAGAVYSTTAQMNQAIADALLPYGTVAQRDAAIAAALAAYYTSAQTDAAIAAAIAPYYTSAETDAAIAAAQLSNGQTWNGGPTFNLLRGSNVLRKLSVAGALTASFQNLDDTILIESDSYARSETYTQAETGAAITAAIDALDLSQFQNEAEVQALIAAALSTYVAGELANYATSSSVTSAISAALSSYDDSSQVDSKIITALLDFYTRTSRSRDCQCAGERGSVELLHPGRDAELRGRRAAGVLPSDRTGFPAHGHLPAVLDQLANPNRDRRRHPPPKRRPTRGGQRQRKLRVPGAHQRDAPNDQGAPASGAPGGQHHPLGHHARAHLRRLHQGGSGRALFEQQQLRAARRQVLPVGGRGQRPLPPRPGAVHAPLHPQPALLPPPSSLLPPPSSSLLPAPSLLLPPPSSLSPPPPSPLLRKRSRMGTAPQRERSDTPDPRRGFAGELKDGHGTTARALRHARSPQRVRRRAIRHARSPQRVRRRAQGFARHHSESAPTRPIPAEGSSASSRIRTAPHRSAQRVRRRALRHARSL